MQSGRRDNMTVTGKGNFPFLSSWMYNGTFDTLKKQVFFGDTDQSLLTIMTDWFFEPAGEGPTYYGILKRWAGASWVKEPLKVYLAGLWQTKPLKYWDGTAWRLIDTTGV
jgi:hypothetical protein